MKLNVFYLFVMVFSLQFFVSCNEEDIEIPEVHETFECKFATSFESDFLKEQKVSPDASIVITPKQVVSKDYNFEINDLVINFESSVPGLYNFDVKVDGNSSQLFHFTFSVSPLTEKSFEFQGASRFHSNFFKEQGFTAADVFEISPQETESTNYFFEINEAAIVFDSPIVGAYKFNVTVNSDIVFHLTFNVTPILVNPYLSSKGELSPYISRVFDYMPAPGQFINTMPAYEDGDTQEDMNRKTEEALAKKRADMISLGGFGGSVTFGFDHSIVNLTDKCDFKVLGNAFLSNQQGDDPLDPRNGGSCEPGIVYVSYDINKNGEPDDEWYEIAGSAYSTSGNEDFYAFLNSKGLNLDVVSDYELTYFKPTSEDVAPEEYIRWTDNKEDTGFLPKNAYHQQSYYPKWITDASIKYTGKKLPNNSWDLSGTGHMYVLYPFKYGYVDNQVNDTDQAGIDISWAVDKNGNKVNLVAVNFVKVQCAVNQVNGWLGECSTEVMGAQDLHLLGMDISSNFE